MSFQIAINTTCTGHGKYVHDTLISITKQKTQYGVKEGLMPISAEDSIAGTTCPWLTSKFDPTQTDHKYERQFIEVPADDIIVANSPTDRVLTKDKKGIKSPKLLVAFATMVPSNVKENNAWICPCKQDILGNFNECGQKTHCGDWVDCNLKEHVSHESLQPRGNPRKRRRE